MSYLQRAGEWFAFCTRTGRYCRRLTLYEEMDWGIEVALDECQSVALGNQGGPIAVAPQHVNEVMVYTNAGRFIKRFSLPLEAGQVVKLGWSRDEHVVVLTTKYHVLVFELGAQAPSVGASVQPSYHFRLAQNSTAAPSLVVIRPAGVFTIDTNAVMRGVFFEERREPEPFEVELADYLQCTPAAMEILPKELNEDGETLVYIAPGEDDEACGTLLVVNLAEAEVTDLDLDVPYGVAHIAMRHDVGAFALCTFGSQILVVSPDFSSIIFSFSIGTAKPPLSVHWCGLDFLFATYSHAQMDEYGDSGQFAFIIPCHPNMEVKFETISWDTDGSGVAAIVPEVDGVRVVTETACYFVESVPPCLARLFQLKSTAPTAVVADAYQDYLRDDVSGIVQIRKLTAAMGSDFADVVDELVDAACCEVELYQQEQVLAVAAFAKSFCAGYDADRYVDAMKRLRVLNSVRSPPCSVAITLRQYQTFSGADQLRHLSPSEAQVLVDRLVNRHEFQLAYDIGTLLRMRVEKVLVRWSCVKVQQTSLPDEEIHESIASVLSQYPGASFTDAALMAYRSNREALAIRLLHDEPRSQNKVMMFMQMQQDELALRMALDSFDADLVHLVLLRTLNRLSPQGAVNLLMRLPSAQMLLAHAAQVLHSWRRPAIMLHEDLNQTHLTACSRLEALLRHEDPEFLATLREKKRPDEASCETELSAADDNVPTAAESAENSERPEPQKSRWAFFRRARQPSSSRGEEAALNSGGAGAEPAFVKDVHEAAAQLDSALTEFILTSRREPIQGTTAVTASDLISVSALFAESTKPAADSSSRWCKLHMDLLKAQDRLCETTNDEAFRNASIIETVRLCFQHGLDKEADTIRVTFNVTDKKFWFVKLAALCAAGSWDAVDKLGGGGKYSKVKSPIGFLPFVEVLASHQREEQAAVFVARLPDVYDRVEWYVRLDNFQKAIDDAYDDENVDLIAQIRRRATNPTIIEYATKRLKALE